MTIQTLSMNLKGDQGNGIQVISTDLLTNGDTQVIFGEFNPAGAEIDTALRTTITIPRGNTFSSGSERPLDDNPEGIEGDVFLDTDDDKFYSRGSNGVWTEQADFTGATGASPVFNVTIDPSTIAAGGDPTASIDNTDPLIPILELGLVTGNTGGSISVGTLDETTERTILPIVNSDPLIDDVPVTITNGIDGIDSVLAPPTIDGTYNYVVSNGGTTGVWTDHVGVNPLVKEITTALFETTAAVPLVPAVPAIPRVASRVRIDLSAVTSTIGVSENTLFQFTVNKFTTDVGASDDARNSLRIFSRVGNSDNYGFTSSANDFQMFQNWNLDNNPFDAEATIDALEAQFQVGNTAVFQDGTVSTGVFRMSFTKESATTGFFAIDGVDLPNTMIDGGLGITSTLIAAVAEVPEVPEIPEVPAVFTELLNEVVLINNDTVRYTDLAGTDVRVFKYIGGGVTFAEQQPLTRVPAGSGANFRLI